MYIGHKKLLVAYLLPVKSLKPEKRSGYEISFACYQLYPKQLLRIKGNFIYLMAMIPIWGIYEIDVGYTEVK